MTDTPINELQGFTPLAHEHAWGTAQCTGAPQDQQARVGELIKVCLICFDTSGGWQTPNPSDYSTGRARPQRRDNGGPPPRVPGQKMPIHPALPNPTPTGDNFHRIEDDLDLRPDRMIVMPPSNEAALLKQILDRLEQIVERLG